MDTEWDLAGPSGADRPWDSVRRQLLSRVDGVVDGDFAAVEAGPYYVQVARQRSTLLFEVCSNRYLAGEPLLSPAQELRLVEMGWQPPAADGYYVNFYRFLDRCQRYRGVAMWVEALRDVLQVHPHQVT